MCNLARDEERREAAGDLLLHENVDVSCEDFAHMMDDEYRITQLLGNSFTHVG